MSYYIILEIFLKGLVKILKQATSNNKNHLPLNLFKISTLIFKLTLGSGLGIWSFVIPELSIMIDESSSN